MTPLYFGFEWSTALKPYQVVFLRPQMTQKHQKIKMDRPVTRIYTGICTSNEQSQCILESPWADSNRYSCLDVDSVQDTSSTYSENELYGAPYSAVSDVLRKPDPPDPPPHQSREGLFEATPAGAEPEPEREPEPELDPETQEELRTRLLQGLALSVAEAVSGAWSDMGSSLASDIAESLSKDMKDEDSN